MSEDELDITAKVKSQVVAAVIPREDTEMNEEEDDIESSDQTEEHQKDSYYSPSEESE
jgi:hypothetical protein